MSYLIALGGHRKTIKVIKLLCAKQALVTGITKEIVMTHNNRNFFVCYKCLVLKYGTLNTPHKFASKSGTNVYKTLESC